MQPSTIAALGLAAGIALWGTSPAEAREYPWCLEDRMFDGGSIRTCGFMTLDQCVAMRPSPASGNCYPNPAFRGSAGHQRARPRKHRGKR
ncbi:DUF3551 domain-containing protein [Blastochloris tepida]|uniref:DUF3551 domain-containing protein n=1 Tax=Blastochloris tepida TaxID=2233851 RepID=A0A348FY01_9HYPH|nr:hypothetical protein BLTE_08690 [Blastochloris tepida]